MNKLLALLAVGLLFVVACGPASPAASPAPTVVNATLSDNKITLSTKTAVAGTVTFNVTNTGATEHELVVLKTDLGEDKIPADADEPGKVSEDGNLGESGDLTAGASKTFSLQLPAGSYVLICNEVGHYLLGMHTAFVVR